MKLLAIYTASLLPALLIAFTGLRAQDGSQQAITSAGGSSKAISGYTVDYTVGQPVIATFQNGNKNAVTQGIQQPLYEPDFPIAPTILWADKGDETTGLGWFCASEYHNAWFYIERSADGKDFQVIDSLPTNIPNGTTPLPHDYYKTDLQPMHGYNYYRIRQLNSFGGISFSNTVRVNFVGKPWRIWAYPNPVHSTLHLKIFSDVNTRGILRMTNLSGKELIQTVVSLEDGYNDLTLPMENATNGMYILSISDLNSSREVIDKIIKL